MIRANEAKKIVSEYQEKLFFETEKKVNDFSELMSKNIELYSEKGVNELAFKPYEISRFPSKTMMEMASLIFQVILISNGYEIVINDWQKNILKIRW